ncbi:hypothetical protein [Streptomyces sp. Z26]|uniref:hypothetical protein n=1 Tax=Streptomyces TaxID=1883 RepID=UPI000EF13DE0|nr:hypothetical protein [Streptomyces sp. Z26]RLL67741.1 hypothetical protein D7M15_13830 [Streptomyces sp. Z26]
MTTRQETQSRVVEAAAKAAASTPGVAFLRPGLADLLRGSTYGARGGGPRTPGVRARHTDVPEGWHLQLHLAVLRGHQAAGVTRAVRTSVETAVHAALIALAAERPDDAAGTHGARGTAGKAAAVSVTVTVTDIA